MAATNFQADLGAALPSGAPIRLVGKPSVWPGLGFNVVGLDDTYSPSTPVTPSNGLGALSIVSGIIDATYDQDRFIWTAPVACVVVSFILQQSAIEATSATTTLDVKKCPSGTAPSAGTTLLSAAVNLKTGVVANTPLTLTLTATTANLTMAAGDSLALDFTNAITEYVGTLQAQINLI